MSIGIRENLTESFGYAKDKLVGSIGNWIILMILTIIPIVNFIAMGTYLKVYRGEDPKVENIGKSFVDGLLLFIIAFIYMLIPTIIAILLGVGSLMIGSVFMSPTGSVGGAAMFAALAASMGLILLCIIIFILFALIMTPARVNFARKGFGAAFNFSEMFGMVAKAGWLKYILCIIILEVIFGIIGLLGMIPFIGWLVMIIILPFLIVWASKFWTNLFA